MCRLERLGALLLALLTSACTDDAAAPEAGRLAVTRVLGASDDDHAFAQATVVREFQFPEDHGPHPAFRSEWWYLTAVLQDDEGARFGMQFTIFRQALRPPTPVPAAGAWDGSQGYLGHFALTDVAAGLHLESQRFARGHERLAGARARPFGVWLDGWRMQSTGKAFLPLAVAAADLDVGIAVQLEAASLPPILLQGEQGLSRKGEGEASYYYSVPRLPLTGRLRVEDKLVNVTGVGWLDREWSTSSLAPYHEGWDWFALMLDDGTDLMAFQLRRNDGARDPYDYAVRRPAGADPKRFGAEAFDLRPTRWWRDSYGARWPVAWELQLDDDPEVLLIEAALDDQRMATSVVYWEGLVTVRAQNGAALGAGYMELTGYGGSDGAN